MAALDTLMARINKKYGAGTLVRGDELLFHEIPRATTGSLAFDLMLGGGWPLNRWNEIIGQESNGKTAMVLKTVAANQALDPNWHCLWIASEDFVADWAEKLGVDLSRVTVAEVNVMEQAFQIVIDALDERAVDCIVIDSYPALIPSAEDEKLMDELTMGAGAKIMAQFMRKSGKSIKRNLVVEDRPVLGIIVNQWRDRIGVMHGDPRTTPGGKAKNFSFFTRVEVTRADWIAGAQKAKVGIQIKATTIKNKTYPQRKVAAVDFYFDDCTPYRAGDYDRVKEVTTIAAAYEILTRKGAWYYFGEDKWNGFEAVLQSMREEPALAAAVDAQVRQIVLHEGASAVSEESTQSTLL